MTMHRTFARYTAFEAWAWALACAVGFVFLKGYTFGISDQAEHLPQVLRMANAQLYLNDPFVDAATTHFTVRQYYVYLMFGVSRIIPLEWAAFALTLVSIALLAFSVLRMAEHVNTDRISPLLAPMLLLTVLYGCTVGLNHITYASFISSTPAKALGAFGLLSFIRRKYILAGLICGVAALFQVLVGLQLAGILVLLLLMEKRWAPAAKTAVAFAMCSAPMLVPVLMRQFGPSGMAVDSATYFRVLFDFRNPHHYLPWHFPVQHYMVFGLLVLATLLAHRANGENNRTVPHFILIVVVGMVVYAALVSPDAFRGMARLQWFKATVWVTVLGSVALSGLWANLIQKWAQLTRFAPWAAMASSLAGLLVITQSGLIPIEKLQGRYMVGNYRQTDLERLHSWIEANLPTDAVFHIPPDNSGFAVQAKRSHFVSWQAIIHEPFFMMPWYDRFTLAYGVSLTNLHNGEDVLARAIENYSQAYSQGTPLPVNYRIDNLSTCQFTTQLGPILHQEGDWAVTVYNASGYNDFVSSGRLKNGQDEGFH